MPSHEHPRAICQKLYSVIITLRVHDPRPGSVRGTFDSLSQLLARKSIDKLIRESEDPKHSLKKTLGPWSLTAL